MGKKYYGGIGTDKGFVMHSPENKYHYSRDDEFHKEGDKRDVGSASNTGGGNSNSNDSTHNESSDESTGSARAASTHLTTTIATTVTASWTTSSGTSYPLKPASCSQSKACSRRSCHAR